MSEIRVRHRLLADVLADVARTGHPVVTRTEEVAAAFGDLDAFLLAAQHRWYTAFYAHLDAVLEDPHGDLDTAVACMRADLVAAQPALRALLDAHAQRPILALVEAQHRHRVLTDVGVDLAALRLSEVA